MCGILGAVSLSKGFSDAEKALLKESLDMISYRGPDAFDQKYYSSNNILSDNIYLGHRRLSIIDLSDDGIQPLTNDGNLHITFNGEIYNYIELRESLKSDGFEFKTNTDTEVILNLYKRDGIEGFHKLNGMWAFILLDKEENKIITCRDRFAIKPLYIYNNDDSWFFASEIKQLLPFVNDLKPNLNTLGNYLHNYIIDYSNDTFFENIKMLSSKHALIIDLESKENLSYKYWDYKIEETDGRFNEKDLIEEYRELFINSVKIRLRSDVKVGNTLSGGLDSSSIAVIADKVKDEKLKNFSVVTSNKEKSEERFVDLLVKDVDIDVTKILIDDISPWSQVEDVIWNNDEPILSLSTVAHFNMMASFKKETDITVVLSGQGGDEALAGYNKYYFYNLLQTKNDKDYKRLAKELFYFFPKMFNEFKLNNARRYIPFISQSGSIIDKVSNLKFNNIFKEILFDNFQSRQILDIDKFSVPALTHYEDRSSMHKSLEIRLPFLDYRLINFNLNLPLSMKINNGFSKYILRKSIYELPKEIAWRKDKKGFDLDESLYFDVRSVDYIKSLFINSILDSWRVIDAEKFLTEFDLFLMNKTNYWVRNINRIIFAEIWAKKFFG